MKKPSKKTLRNKLDRICSELVRKRGKCERCSKKNSLQAAHIFSRTYNNTRWGLENILCLCASCHFWAHKNPILFAEFVKKILGGEKYELLKEARNQITKYTLQDLETKYHILQEIKEGK